MQLYVNIHLAKLSSHYLWNLQYPACNMKTVYSENQTVTAWYGNAVVFLVETARRTLYKNLNSVNRKKLVYFDCFILTIYLPAPTESCISILLRILYRQRLLTLWHVKTYETGAMAPRQVTLAGPTTSATLERYSFDCFLRFFFLFG